MMTWKTIGKRYEFGMDLMLWLNIFCVYIYICLVGSSDVPALVLLAGLNTVIITFSRREELKRILTPAKEPDEMQAIIRRVK